MMLKLNATEKDMVKFREEILPTLSPEARVLAERLLETSELGLRSFDTVNKIRPLILAIWQGMCEKYDQNRFAIESLIKDMDQFIGFWIVNVENDPK